MADDDSARSTDPVDVLRGAMAAPWLRVLTMWMVSAAGTAACLLIGVLSSSMVSDSEWDAHWLTILGVPLSFIGSVNEWIQSTYHWDGDSDFAHFQSKFEPWQYSMVRVWTFRLLLIPAVLLWLRAAWQVCAGRRPVTCLCHVFATSFLLTASRLEGRWWIGVLLAAAMVVLWFSWPGFRALRAAEGEYERDGI